MNKMFVDVVTTEHGVTIRGFYFSYAIADFQDWNIKRTTTEVEYGDRFVLFLIQT